MERRSRPSPRRRRRGASSSGSRAAASSRRGPGRREAARRWSRPASSSRARDGARCSGRSRRRRSRRPTASVRSAIAIADVVDGELLPVGDVADVLGQRPVRPARVRRRGTRAGARPPRRGRPSDADEAVPERGLVGPQVADRRRGGRGRGRRQAVPGGGRRRGRRVGGRARRHRGVGRPLPSDASSWASSWSPSSTVRRNAAQTASDSTVRSRPLSSSWSAAADVPPGRRDHVPQLGRVHPGLLGEQRRALERLDDEVVRDVAREAEVDGRVDERLHDEEHVGRAGAADRGRHRDHLLVVDLELEAERTEQGGGLRPLLVGRLGRGVPDRHALAEAGRRVGHAAHDLVVAEDAGQGRGRGPGQDAQHELAAAQVRADLAADLVEHLGLDAEQDHVRVADRVRRCRRRSGCRTRARGPRAARRADGWRRPGPGATRPPRSRPAIIASAITPEPTVAIVAFARGDIGRSIATGVRSDPGVRPVRQPAPMPSRKKRPVVVTSISSKPAAASASTSSIRRVEDLDDRELAAVVEATHGALVGGLGMVGRARRRVRQRIDERDLRRPA